MAGEADVLVKEPLIVIVLGSADYYASTSASAINIARYRDIIQKYKTMKVAIILTDLPNASITFGANELTRLVTGHKLVMMYENLGNLKVLEVPLSFQRANRKQLQAGEMYLYKEGDFLKAKTPLWSENET